MEVEGTEKLEERHWLRALRSETLRHRTIIQKEKVSSFLSTAFDTERRRDRNKRPLREVSQPAFETEWLREKPLG